MTDERLDADPVVITGMACRFPGGGSVDEFWTTVLTGSEAISRLKAEDLAAAGEDPRKLDDPDYVPAAGTLPDVAGFDAGFFGFSAREARLMDPQHRAFLECCWHGLENAGVDPERFGGRIGVFGGSGMNRYMHSHVLGGAFPGPVDELEARLANDRDFLTTWVSYKLGLTGPSVGVQTACSTSLVAIHLAAQSLMLYEADAALAGGVTIAVPHGVGYVHRQGGTVSRDGRCLPFDDRASGLVGGSGVGVVVLRRLSDARADGDRILAILRGSAVNNDGGFKVGYTAPSVEGQVAVIRDALSAAQCEPEEVAYVEAHGTGTPVGDPIEIQALNRAYAGAERKSIALGSVKANVGHLDAAAGVAGLIKILLSFEHDRIPPSTYFDRPNPLIDFQGGPFHVNVEPRDWPSDRPAVAGLSSFGMGGTNAHVIVERPPPPPAAGGPDEGLVCLSASTVPALRETMVQLADRLRRREDLRVVDVGRTHAVGRRELPVRWAAAAGSSDQLVERLLAAAQDGEQTTVTDPAPVAFLFPGQGSQRMGMAAALYAAEPSFRRELDRCLDGLSAEVRDRLRPALLSGGDDGEDVLRQTELAQPGLFVVEYALAQVLRSWGIEPHAMIGHSIGEFVAATLAGVFELQDALHVVSERGRLMQTVPPGAMIAVAATEEQVAGMLDSDVSLAAVNGPRQVVLSGPEDAIERTRAAIKDGLNARVHRLATSHAFHSSMVEPIMGEFEAVLRSTAIHRPRRPFYSNLTGMVVADAEVATARYWVRHLREPVRLEPALRHLSETSPLICLEVGPGQGLTSLARGILRGPAQYALPSLSSQHDPREDPERLLETLGAAWARGVRVDWRAFHAERGGRTVTLPGYPFEHKRYWVDGRGTQGATPPPEDPAGEFVAGGDGAPPAAEPQAPRQPDAAAEAPPQPDAESATEAVVREVFAEAFGVDEVRPEDDFFSLGGNSLLASMVVDRLRQRLERPVPVVALFDAPEVRGLARLLDGAHEPPAPEAAGQPEPAYDPDALAAELAGLPEEELEALLLSIEAEEGGPG